MPILSAAKVPQISVSSTRVGLTYDDHRLVDDDEPGRYRHDGFRNFVRTIPNADVHSQALVNLMLKDRCTRVAMIDDDSSYGQDLANHILEKNRLKPATVRMKFRFSNSVAGHGAYLYLRDRAVAEGVNCFVYSGTLNRNTIPIFETFASRLRALRRFGRGVTRPPRLYGSNGLVAENFYGEALPTKVAAQVTLMVPPYDPARFEGFRDAFVHRYGVEPDPYAAYAYDAMDLALEAIKRSETGRRADIVKALFSTRHRPADGLLLDYSINRNGDTSVTRYGWAPIENHALGRLRLVSGSPDS